MPILKLTIAIKVKEEKP